MDSFLYCLGSRNLLRQVLKKSFTNKPYFQDAIQAQLVIQKMSELTTHESPDDLEPISESPSKTFDGDRSSQESSSENDETLEDDDNPVKPEATSNATQNNKEYNTHNMDSENANLDFRTIADVDNNIPVSIL